MNIEKDIVLQPYGKDDVSMNFIVSPMGKWIFGPTDIDKVDVIKSTAMIFNFVKFKAKNPKYYIGPINTDFKLKNVPDRKKWNLTHDTTNCKNIFFFLFYEGSEKFVAMNYTVVEKELDDIEKNLNIISVIAFYGKDFSIVEEDWDHGVTIEKEKLTPILDQMKNEQPYK